MAREQIRNRGEAMIGVAMALRENAVLKGNETFIGRVADNETFQVLSFVASLGDPCRLVRQVKKFDG